MSDTEKEREIERKRYRGRKRKRENERDKQRELTHFSCPIMEPSLLSDNAYFFRGNIFIHAFHRR